MPDQKFSTITPEYKSKLLADEPRATDVVRSVDGRLWYTDGTLAWNYPGAGSYAATLLSNLRLEDGERDA